MISVDFFTAWSRARSLIVTAKELHADDPEAFAEVDAYDFLLRTFG